MTHPDDEISIGAWIKRLTTHGADVFISWTHDTPVRRKEARDAARMLGVRQNRLYFHHAPDQGVAERIGPLLGRFHQMVSDIKPDRICCGAFEQGHIDHDATNCIVNQVFKGPVFEIPFYYTYRTKRPIINRFATPAGQEILHLHPDEQQFKLFLSKQYPSQAIWRNLLLAETRQRMTRPRDARLKATERMRRQTHFDFLKPNLPEPLAEAVRRTPTWMRWEAAVKAIL
jgi:LmbE family N-acetylglucosaminyl deacetylase